MPVYKNYLALIHGQRQCQLAVGTLQAYYKILMFIFNSLLHFFFSNSKKKNSIFRSRLKNGKMKKKKKTCIAIVVALFVHLQTVYVILQTTINYNFSYLRYNIIKCWSLTWIRRPTLVL